MISVWFGTSGSLAVHPAIATPRIITASRPFNGLSIRQSPFAGCALLRWR
jgi:hypothetical protein